MTKELQNLLSLLESPNKENRDLGAIVAQNYKDEFKTHFGYEIAEYQELILFLTKHNQWNSVQSLSEITALWLFGVGIFKLPVAITLLKNLKELSLKNNKSKYLPNQICNLNNLTLLDLDGNQLQVLPPEIEQLPKIKYLFLQNNQFQSLPKEIGQLTNLKYLYLENNQLQSLPKELVQIKSLEGILVEGNPKTIFIPDELKHLINFGSGLKD